jgi:hypothetical protein
MDHRLNRRHSSFHAASPTHGRGRRTRQIRDASQRPCSEILERRALLSDTVTAVDTFADVTDQADGRTSLREAIAAAATRPGDDTITLPAGTYALAQGQLRIKDTSGRLTVRSDGEGATVDASQLAPGPESRVFFVGALSNVELAGLTITGGRVTNATDAFYARGGGIYIDTAKLWLTGSSVVGNAVNSADDFLPTADGGGIFAAARADFIRL